jgi:hypothetical protein
MTDFICTFSDEALCLQDAQLKRAISQPGPLLYWSSTQHAATSSGRRLDQYFGDGGQGSHGSRASRPALAPSAD